MAFFMKKSNKFPIYKLLYVMKKLRDPKKGCPWDKKQTLESIIPHTIEEVYEPFLIKEGFIQRTPRGRIALDKTYKYLGKPNINQTFI